jgi:hypothetical protein
MNYKIEGLNEKELNPNLYGGMCSRSEAAINAAENEEGKIDFEKGIDTIATTEAPAIVMDWSRWMPIREVLLMKYCEMPDNDDAPLLDAHMRYTIDNIKGSARNWNASGDQCLCKAFISETETAVRKKCEEKHIKNVSVGYMTDPQKTVEIPRGKEVIIDGVSYRNDYQDGLPFVVRLWWKVKELSLVPIGADAAAKFRAEMQRPPVTADDPEVQRLINEALQKRSENNQQENLNNHRSNITMSEPTNQPSKDDILKEERERTSGIREYYEKYKAQYKLGEEGVKKALDSGMSIEQFRDHVWDNFDETKSLGRNVGELGMTKRDMEKFSITRVINAQLEKNWKGAEFERECCDEVAKDMSDELGKSAQGVFIPVDIINAKAAAIINYQMQRAVNVGTPAEGGFLVGTQHSAELIDVLRAKTVLGAAGARFIGGLRDNLEIPKKTSSSILSFNGETGYSEASELAFGQLTASPKEGDVSLQYTRKSLKQGSPAVDALVMDDIIWAEKLGINKHGLEGTGAANHVRGLFNQTGIKDISGTAIDWAKIVQFETEIEDADVDAATMKWIMTPRVKGICKTKEKLQGQQGFLMDSSGRMNEYESLTTTQLTAGRMALGDWSNLWVLQWGAPDLIVNPFQANPKYIKVTLISWFDIICRYAQAFCVSTTVSPQ